MKFSVIFDMDGVLVNSMESILEAYNKALKNHGITVSGKDVKHYNGLSIFDTIDVWKKKYKIEINIEDFIEEVNKIEAELLKKNHKPNIELIKFIKDLRKNKIALAVGSSSTRSRINRIIKLAKLEKYFSVIVGAEDVKNHKPDPDIFLKAVEKLNSTPEKCVVIEDAPLGIEAAKRANMKSIALLTPYHTKTQFKQADLIVRNFSELSFSKIKTLF